MKKRYIGIDIGGTKIAAGLVDARGGILLRKKISSSGKSGREVVKDLSSLISKLLHKGGARAAQVEAVGIAVPGLVDTVSGRIITTPNMGLSGIDLAAELKKRHPLRILVGNDVNLGLLGEQWLGAGRGARDLIGLFPGTGLGGAAIIDGRLLTGSNGAAAEFGHMIVDPDGPQCTCGNKGCLEAFVGRWAIQRDIRAALKKGKKSLILKLTDGDLSVIKSKALAKALRKKDKVVTAVMKKMSAVLGTGCVSLRHIFDPEVIILGGGVIEACERFILPVVRKAVKSDPFFKPFKKCRVVSASLGDDAVMLGAVAFCLAAKNSR